MDKKTYSTTGNKEHFVTFFVYDMADYFEQLGLYYYSEKDIPYHPKYVYVVCMFHLASYDVICNTNNMYLTEKFLSTLLRARLYVALWIQNLLMVDGLKSSTDHNLFTNFDRQNILQ